MEFSISRQSKSFIIWSDFTFLSISYNNSDVKTRNKSRQEFGLFMQNKCSYLINSWCMADLFARVRMENIHVT